MCEIVILYIILRGLIFANAESKNFAWINFCEDIYYLRNIFLLRKRLCFRSKAFTILQKITPQISRLYKESDSDSESLIVNKKICLVNQSGFFLDHCGHSKNTLAEKGQSDEKRTVMYFSHHLKYVKKERKRVKIGEIRKLFESPRTNFKHR